MTFCSVIAVDSYSAPDFKGLVFVLGSIFTVHVNRSSSNWDGMVLLFYEENSSLISCSLSFFILNSALPLVHVLPSV